MLGDACRGDAGRGMLGDACRGDAGRGMLGDACRGVQAGGCWQGGAGRGVQAGGCRQGDAGRAARSARGQRGSGAVGDAGRPAGRQVHGAAEGWRMHRCCAKACAAASCPPPPSDPSMTSTPTSARLKALRSTGEQAVQACARQQLPQRSARPRPQRGVQQSQQRGRVRPCDTSAAPPLALCRSPPDGAVHRDLLRPILAVGHLGPLADAGGVHQLELLAIGQGDLRRAAGAGAGARSARAVLLLLLPPQLRQPQRRGQARHPLRRRSTHAVQHARPALQLLQKAGRPAAPRAPACPPRPWWCRSCRTRSSAPRRRWR